MISASPSLERFEMLVENGEHRAAMSEAFEILHILEIDNGQLSRIEVGANARTDPEGIVHFAKRFYSALRRLLTDSNFQFAPEEFEYLILFHRWIDLLAAVAEPDSPPELSVGHDEPTRALDIPVGRLEAMLAVLPLKLLSRLDLEALHQAYPAALFAFVNYLNSRTIFSKEAYRLREWLLDWLPLRLRNHPIAFVKHERLLEVFLLSSYATTPGKHQIKRLILEQVRAACIAAGFDDIRLAELPSAGARPVVVVICEHMSLNHSVFRTHSRAIAALKERFHVVGIVTKHQIHDAMAVVFDEIVPVEQGSLFAMLAPIVAEVRKRRPAAIIYPSIGMAPHVIALSSLRLAPVQCTSWGHGASSMSPMIDCMIMPENLVGSRACYTEAVVALPSRAMPFMPVSRVQRKASMRREENGPVRVAIASSIMKLNPSFFGALGKISRSTALKPEFQFFPPYAQGIIAVALRKALHAQVPGSRVFDEAPFDVYMERLGNCDFFLCPFPYGNANSIVDAVELGLPGVCLDGPEPHQHFDAGLFEQIGLPAAFIANSIDEYVAIALRLIEDVEWRRECREMVASRDLQAALYSGDPRLFSAAVAEFIASSGTTPAR